MGNGLAKMGACTLAEERRQDEDPALLGRRARQRPHRPRRACAPARSRWCSPRPRRWRASCRRWASSTCRSCSTTRRRPTRCSTARSATGSPPSCRPSALVNLAWWENGFRHTTNSQAPDHQGRGLRRREDARDAEQHLHRHLQDAGQQRGADGVLRGLFGARDQDGGRPGEPVQQHREHEVLRGAEVPDADQARLQPDAGAVLQEDLGHAVAAGAGRAARMRRCRAATSSAASTARRQRERGQPQVQGHAGQRDRAGRDAAHPRQVERDLRAPRARRSATRRSRWCPASSSASAATEQRDPR